MKKLATPLLCLLLCSGCSVVSATGSVVSTGVSVAGSVVSTGVSVTGSAIRGVSSAISASIDSK